MTILPTPANRPVAMTLNRFGRAPEGWMLPMIPLHDGYWTPWHEADAEIAQLRAENAELRRLLARYRDETPLGHQPHMIARQADDAIGRR